MQLVQGRLWRALPQTLRSQPGVGHDPAERARRISKRSEGLTST
jgi:hypothetical protein